ncbi:bifunctional protein-disulfide isomerase/oxidoreductase DsbC [Providencia sneebia]|uniref:Thiol:disulfide interchange protein n=1 Tax=Providencia sneebia DSM 19967 TaxID=1141660 RepID=K8WI60_9GAMM|nr:bifunctional protein-disulfide isomerase/oxidoreductase DsbC [Providencia sneebia]EKT55880.1 thiol:disulfide interchange protein DsbC [Providencia sneebia DSM 19967]
MKRKLLLWAACIASFSLSVSASTNDKIIQEKLAKYNLSVESIKPSPIVGLNTVDTSDGIIYVTDDGKYLLQGPIYDLSGKTVVNISNQPLMKKVDALKDEMIIFKAPKEKYVITVFTDISCGYCKKLHESVEELNDKGITVRYLAYPRRGLEHESAKQMASIWCNALPQSALTKAFKGDGIAMIDECKIDLSKHIKLGKQFKMTGTPAIILPDGQLLSGYAKPDDLLKMLEQK